MNALVLCALFGALPHPTSPAGAAPVYRPEIAGPQRQYQYADPYGDGSRVLILGFYDQSGVFRFYEQENPHLYNRKPAVYRGPGPAVGHAPGVTVDADGTLNSGIAVGNRPHATDSLVTNSEVGGEVFQEATAEAEIERRRRCTPDRPCPDDPDASDPDGSDDTGTAPRPAPRPSPALSSDQALGLGLALAFVIGVVVALRRRAAQ